MRPRRGKREVNLDSSAGPQLLASLPDPLVTNSTPSRSMPRCTSFFSSATLLVCPSDSTKPRSGPDRAYDSAGISRNSMKEKAWVMFAAAKG